MEKTTAVGKCLLDLCRQHMGGHWVKNTHDISVSVVTGGLVNSLFLLKIEHKEDIANIPNSPTCCLLRIFADIWSQDEITRNNIVTAVLAERGIGPKIYGIFPGSQGRLEEFYECRALNASELIPNFDTIADMAGRFNRQSLPLPKNGRFLSDSMQRFLDKINSSPIQIEANRARIVELRNAISWKDEIQWLNEYLQSVGSPILVCHNDLNESNFLLLTDGQLKLIDFEFCSYNYRGFELAQLFYECSLSYHVPDFPYFKRTPGDYPSYEKRCEFVSKYLSAFQPDIIHSKAEIDSVVQEVERMKLSVDLYWALWALTMAIVDDRFPYIEYTELRIQMYLSEKSKLVT